MPKYRDFAHLDVLPASWTDAIQEFIGTGLYNFSLIQVDNTTIRVPAGTGNAQVAIGIDGLFRWNTTNVNTVHPGGAAGQYDVFVTTSENIFSNSPQPDTDLTDYSFGLVIRPQGSTPATPHFRKIGEVTWDGTKIVLVSLFPPLPKHVFTHLPTGTDPLPHDDIATVASLRTLGPGAQQAVPGTDSRLPTQPENDALIGTNGSPSGTNPYVTNTDPRLTPSGVPPNHAIRHAPNGADALDYSVVHMRGTLAGRPAASSQNANLLYLATDDNGGQMYRSTGSAWEKTGSPVTPAAVEPPFVTLAQFAALTPTDNMRVVLQVDAALGINWPLRYNASSASPYKWEANGEGTALFSRSHAVGLWKPTTWPFLEGATDTGWLGVIGGFTGPSIAVPRAGDYYVKFGAHGWIDYYFYPYYWGPHVDSPTGSGWMSISGCGIVPDDDQLVCYFPHLHPASPYTVRRLTLTAGTLAANYRSYAYSIGYFLRLYAQNRSLEVVPIRIA